MRKMIALTILLLVGACQAAGVATQTFDPAGAQKTVYALKASYAALLTGAVAYNKRPRCGHPTSPITCSDPAIVAQARKADAAVETALDAAESAVRSLSASPTVVEAAIKGAQAALDAFMAVSSVYK
jgi:hypothetical protein